MQCGIYGRKCGHNANTSDPFISTSKELLQETSIAFAAISRNSHLLTNLTGTQAGMGTKNTLYEVITTGIVVAKSRIAHVLGGGRQAQLQESIPALRQDSRVKSCMGSKGQP